MAKLDKWLSDELIGMSYRLKQLEEGVRDIRKLVLDANSNAVDALDAVLSKVDELLDHEYEDAD